ncbi:MAG: glycine--tRNA ligase subunit beta [Legionella sp. 40-6]|nr:glycine--tRNA ligase subunit beta [Legionella sp.]OJY41543.1 MAG: glycine--tRNA ligase subunit beta [Legionella sp. 40-6]
MVNDFLFELGCEELPSGAVLTLAEELKHLLITALDKAQLRHGEVKLFATPRRLALLVTDLESEQQSQEITRKGPAVIAAFDKEGRPTPALMGFAKSCGVDIAALTRVNTDKGEWFVYQHTTEGKKTAAILPHLITQAVADLTIAKRMRWGAGDEEFARPVHWVVMLYGNEVIPHSLLGVETGRFTFGHRFHHPEAISIDSPRSYEAQLHHAYVIADFQQRQQEIVRQIQQLGATQDAQVLMPGTLVQEVTSIVEWPNALMASFAAEFLEVPAEALIASMQSHQKCFALRDKNGRLLPHFITVTNIDSKNPAQVVAGNEKVMRARLSDAAFFYRQDKKTALATRIPLTEQVVFQAKLGSLADKTLRVKGLMTYVAEPLQLDLPQALRAVELSKCDLLSGMVGEFPELQGLMGYYYARHDGEDDAVAVALNEQYMPRFAADALPETVLGRALSLVDRLDTLVGIFAIGQKPTGVKDPFKLRRHALAVLRILISIPNQLPLSVLISQAKLQYAERIKIDESIANDLQTFILERLNAYYTAQGIGIDMVHAAKACQHDWLYDLDLRIHSLQTFVKLPEASSLAAACKRVKNILAQNSLHAADVNPELLTEPAEQALYKHLEQTRQHVELLIKQADYEGILKLLAGLKEPIDAFFEQVMVMVDEPELKNNRLALLLAMQTLLQSVADIGLLQ